MKKKYLNYVMDQLEKLINIDSPTAFTDDCAEYVKAEIEKLGYSPKMLNKGGVFVDLGGKSDDANGVLLYAHIDTIGALVRHIKPNGRLEMTRIGGGNQNSIEANDVRVHTRDGKVYTGTVQLVNASVHANPAARDAINRTWDNLEVILDEDVNSAAETLALGIEKGNVVAFDPKFKVTDSGYIKSRFLDDKMLVAIVLGFAKYIKEEKAELLRKVCVHFSCYEETGHGVGGIMPNGISEALALDMGCVGDCTDGNEKSVSICIADLGGPYDVKTTDNLVKAAKLAGIDYSADVYPNYSSDSDEAVSLYDVRHALIGPGIYASHGYERGHIDGIKNTFDLLLAYLTK